jgi:oxaloacetate decarboxylase alpha subunit
MADASAYLTRQARIKRLPSGAPAEYDEDYYRHNIPGGVLATLARQLSEIRRPELLPAVKEEAVRVREDLGWPIVVTPFAQYIVTQATLNVMSGRRYAQIADEIVDLLRGDFGPLPGPVDQDLLDRAMATKRAQQPLPGEDDVTLDQLRDRFGRQLPDEELLLRAVMPAEQVDAMVAARGRSTRDVVGRVLSMLDERPGVTSFSLAQGGTRISVQREAP